MEMSAALDAYLFTKDFTSAGMRWYTQKLHAFVDWCYEQGITDIEHVTAIHVMTYAKVLRSTPSERFGKPITSHTLHGYVRVIKAFLNWCVKQDLVDPKVPARIEMPKRDVKVIGIFTPQHIADMLKACEDDELEWLAERNKTIVILLLDTGIRLNELCGLRLSDVHLSVEESYIVVNGKGRKQREVAVGNKARMQLHRYLYRYRPKVKDDYVFQSKKGHLTAVGVDKMIARLRDRAGIEGVRVSPHTFRHTMACRYIEGGGDIMRLSRMLGHTSLAVTQEYLKAFTSRQARHGGLSVFDNL